MSLTELVLGGVAAIIIIFLMIKLYNIFVEKRNKVKKAFSEIAARLEQRFSLVPNLAAAVQAYAKHESDTLAQITAYRSRAMAPSTSIAERMECGAAASGLMHSIMVQLESYPVLQANNNFLHLQESLDDIERLIASSRRNYNEIVTDYNTTIQIFPNCLFAALFHFRSFPLFEVMEGDCKNPDIKELLR